MNSPVKNNDLESRIFAARPGNFESLAIELFHFQYEHNSLYQAYCKTLGCDPGKVVSMERIPFLPIQFFKSHEVTSTAFAAPPAGEQTLVFESSGTTGSINSKHFIKRPEVYKKSFLSGFNKFYGEPRQHCIIGLLPSYLERSNSSLVYMVAELIRQSEDFLGGFYLNDLEKLQQTILHNEIRRRSTLLIGVTYALLDFAEKFPMQLRHTIVMETGGMKGRREEMTRPEVHAILEKRLGVPAVHSEYGMTELLSQAYSKGNGFFHSAPWMKILIREEDDPLVVHKAGAMQDKPVSGAINIIDLANIYSCAFIATDDAGKLHPDGSFEVIGRLDASDVRGCSFMAL